MKPSTGLNPGTRFTGWTQKARSAIKLMWPTIAPHLENAVDAILDAAANLPNVAAITRQHRALIKQLELSHLEALLNGDLGAPYFESCQKTVEQEAALGFDARLRSTAGNYVLRAAIDALARKHRFAPAKLAESTKLLSQAIAFDVANAMTLHREAASKAAQVRRTTIDEAIADFGSAIGDVLKAITDASTSLTATCSTMREVADETLNRMAVASKAASETTQRVMITSQATEELSGSIQHIGQEATRGLDMARAAVGDTQRAQQAIRRSTTPPNASARSSASSRRSHHKPTCWRSTQPSKRRAPARPARDSQWSLPK